MVDQLFPKIPIWRGAPISRLTVASTGTSGRNNRGRITSHHRGGLSRRYRIIDFRRLFRHTYARVLRFERDPGRTAPLALLCYGNGVLSYILAPRNLHGYSRILASKMALIMPRQ